MSKRDLVSEEVLQELINKLEEIVNNYCYNLEYFTPTDIEGFFDGTQQEIDYYSSLIKDDVVSKNFLHSSKQIADDIAKSILEANEYTDNLVKNISSIKLKYVTSLPTSDISEQTIYILKASDGTSKDTLNLYNATDGWISIGEFDISLDDYYNKTEIDTKMDLKANKTEVVANDKIVQTLGSATNSSDTVLSTSGLQTEMDKKANDDEVIKKADIKTTLDQNSTYTDVCSGKTIFDTINEMKTNFQDGVNTIYDSVVAKGVTPVDKSPSEISNAIANIGEIKKEAELIYTKNNIISSYNITDTKFKKYIISGSYFGDSYSFEREITVSNGIGKKLDFFIYNNSTIKICQGVYIVEKNSKEDQTKITFNHTFNMLSIVGII